MRTLRLGSQTHCLQNILESSISDIFGMQYYMDTFTVKHPS